MLSVPGARVVRVVAGRSALAVARAPERDDLPDELSVRVVEQLGL